jgi:small subunit ribosomal protein S6e
MPVFKFVISQGKKSYQVEKDQGDCPVIGKKIGDSISGGFLGLEGYDLIITGGHDKDGFPMRKDIEGVSRKKIILTKGDGFSGRLRRKKKLTKSRGGLRKRKMLRGNTKIGRAHV